MRRLSATPLGAKKINKKIILLLFLVVFLLIILFPIIHKHNNIGMSLSTLSVKKENRTNNLREIISLDNKRFIVFFSYGCSSCKSLINNTSVRNQFIIINIDYYKNIPVDVFQLIPTPEFEIYYIPYIVEIDSSMKIIKEYKLYEIEEKIKNNELL